jgi:hypothetical protein
VRKPVAHALACAKSARIFKSVLGIPADSCHALGVGGIYQFLLETLIVRTMIGFAELTFRKILGLP